MSSECEMRFRFANDDEVASRITVSARPILDSIVDGVAGAFAAGHVPVSVGDAAGDLAAAMTEVAARQAVVTRLQEQREHLLDAIQSGGVEIVLRAGLNERFQHLESEIPHAKAALTEAEMTYREAQKQDEKRLARNKADQILYFLACLGDTHSIEARDFLQSAITHLSFSTRIVEGGRLWLDWTGTLELGAGSTPLVIAFHGTQPTLQTTRLSANDYASLLVAGVPLRIGFPHTRGVKMPFTNVEIEKRLQLPPGSAWIARVSHPLLLRGYPALYSGLGADFTDLEAEMGAVFGTPALVRAHLERCFERRTFLTRPQWATERSPVETAGLINAARGVPITRSMLAKIAPFRADTCAEIWPIGPSGRSPEPCAWCQSRARARLVIDEPDGYICLACRRDRSGLTWPSAFDEYIAHPASWVAAGFALNLPPKPSTEAMKVPKRSHQSRQQRLDKLTAAQVQAILKDYRDRLPLRALVTKHGLKDEHDIYALAKQNNVSSIRFPGRPLSGGS